MHLFGLTVHKVQSMFNNALFPAEVEIAGRKEHQAIRKERHAKKIDNFQYFSIRLFFKTVYIITFLLAHGQYVNLLPNCHGLGCLITSQAVASLVCLSM